MKNIDFNIKTIIKYAKNRGIPVIDLWNSEFYQLGYGYKGRIIKDNINLNSSFISIDILKDRLLTSQILRSHNIPMISRKKIYNIKELVDISDKLKYPLVMKPQFITKKSIVSCDIKTKKELIKYYEFISKKHKHIILEECIEGKKYQVCVVKDKVVAVTLRDRSSYKDNKYIYRDFTDIISEENKEICISIAKILGLDICNIDIISLDIYCSLKKQGSVIEISINPEIKVHDFLCVDRNFKVTDKILEYLNEIVGVVPIISILGAGNKEIIGKTANYILSKIGYKVGLKLENEIVINNQLIYKGLDEIKLKSENVLINKIVEIVILELNENLNYDFNMQHNSLGIALITKYEPKFKNTILNIIKNNKIIIIDADDFEKFNLLLNKQSKKILFSINAQNKILQQNIAEGGIGVYLSDDIIYVENNNKKYKIVNINDINIELKNDNDTLIGIITTTATLVAFGVDYCMISKGLKEFFNK